MEWDPRLYEWQSAESLEKLIDELAEPLGHRFITGPYTNLREGHIAACFVLDAFPGRRVRLVRPPLTKPDFEIEGDPPIGFEVVEAMELDRKRNDEYVGDAPLIREQPEELNNWTSAEPLIYAALKDRAAKKAAKEYPPGTNLLLYFNIQANGGTNLRILKVARHAMAATFNRFNEVWITRGSAGNTFRLSP